MSSIVIAGDTSGSVTLQAPAVAGSSVLSLPAVTDTLAGIAATQTLTNKTLTSPTLTTPVAVQQLVSVRLPHLPLVRVLLSPQRSQPVRTQTPWTITKKVLGHLLLRM
jgi:hypothetical protein